MPRLHLAAALLASALAAPALAQSGGCASGGPDGGARVTMVAASWDTSEVPRMGAGSDLVTQKASFRNLTAQRQDFTIQLNHRAFQTRPVAGRSFSLAAGQQMEVTLGNILPQGSGTARGLSLEALRGSTSLDCGGMRPKAAM